MAQLLLNKTRKEPKMHTATIDSTKRFVHVERARRYDIDAIRVFAFFTLILYHVGMYYVEGWTWHLKSDHQSSALAWPMIFVNQWRMSLIFLVSGLALSFIIGHYSVRRIIAKRVYRLGVPFAIAMVLIIPIQPYLELISKAQSFPVLGELSYLEFLWRYVQLSDWPHSAFDGAAYGFIWNHLWFIPYLLLYSILIAIFHPLIKKVNIGERWAKTGLFGIVVCPIALQILWKLVLDDSKPISHTLVDDGYAHGLYFTYFFCGYLISNQTNLWCKLNAHRWFLLAGAVSCFMLLLLFWVVFNSAQWHHHCFGVIASTNQWLWILVILSWASAYLNRPSRFVSSINTHIYAWYILHQTVILIFAYWLNQLRLSGILEAAALVTCTYLSCYFIVHKVIARFHVTQHMFGSR